MKLRKVLYGVLQNMSVPVSTECGGLRAIGMRTL